MEMLETSTPEPWPAKTNMESSYTEVFSVINETIGLPQVNKSDSILAKHALPAPTRSHGRRKATPNIYTNEVVDFSY